MTCESVRAELVAFHFGTIVPEVRTGIEAHLSACAACLSEYLGVKRQIELAEDGPAPSPAARDRLREAVARELRPATVRPAWRWWERPFALGLAGAALVIAMAVTQLASSGPGDPPRTLERRADLPGP